GPLPASRVKYHGHYVHGDKVILKYEVHGREVLEMPGAEKDADQIVLTRTFRVAPSNQRIDALMVHHTEDKVLAALSKDFKTHAVDVPLPDGKGLMAGLT